MYHGKWCLPLDLQEADAITPRHPVMYQGKWCLPLDLQEADTDTTSTSSSNMIEALPEAAMLFQYTRRF